MLKSFFNWFLDQLNLSREVAQLRAENKEIRQEQKEQANALRDALFQMERDRDHWRHEFEKLVLVLRLELREGSPRPPLKDDETKE